MPTHSLISITPEAFHQNHGTPLALLIDIREPEEWVEKHIPGARHIPKALLLSDPTHYIPNKETPVYLHCLKGIRSLLAGEALIAEGYKMVYTLEGGIVLWEEQGYGVQTK